MIDADSSPNQPYYPPYDLDPGASSDILPYDAVPSPIPHAITGESLPDADGAYVQPKITPDVATPPSSLIGGETGIDSTYGGIGSVTLGTASVGEAVQLKSTDDQTNEPGTEHAVGSNPETGEPAAEAPPDEPANPPAAGGTPPMPPRDQHGAPTGFPEDEGDGVGEPDEPETQLAGKIIETQLGAAEDADDPDRVAREADIAAILGRLADALDAHRDQAAPARVEAHDRPEARDRAEPPSGTPLEPGAVKITHIPGHDVIANRAHPNQQLVDRAQAAIIDGDGDIPNSWVRLPMRDTERLFYADSATNPTLFAKVRDAVSIQHYRDGLFAARHILTPGTGPADRPLQAILNARHSVLNELHLAPEISNVLATDEVHDILQRHGYESINYVAPLAATVNNRTGIKTVMYPWQAGFSTKQIEAGGTPFDSGEVHKLYAVASDLKAAFTANNIAAIDLFGGQLLVNQTDTGKHLGLVDAEKYFRETDPRFRAR